MLAMWTVNSHSLGVVIQQPRLDQDSVVQALFQRIVRPLVMSEKLNHFSQQRVVVAALSGQPLVALLGRQFQCGEKKLLEPDG
jgi:hypothetical protein